MTISKRNSGWFAAAFAAVMISAMLTAVSARAQSDSSSKLANKTIIVRTSFGNESLAMSSNGCSGSVSGPGTFIGIGDGCWAWSDIGDVPRGLRVRVVADRIEFTRERQSYVINDAATVKRARGIFAQMNDILQQQMELGAKQRALGEKQREVKVSVPDMSADFAKVEADAKRLATQGGTQSELGDLQSELGDLQSRIGDLQSTAGDAQSVLGDAQSRLGDQQSALGEKSQDIARDALVKLQALLTQAIQSGTAKKQ